FNWGDGFFLKSGLPGLPFISTKSEASFDLSRSRQGELSGQIKRKSAAELAEEIKKYKDVEGLSTKKLNFGLWYVKHRRQLCLLLIVFLIIIASVSWAYTIYGFAYYIVRGMNEDERLIREMAQTNIIGHNYIKQIAAKDLKYYPIKILNSTKGKYDFIVKIQNPNQKWRAEFDYYFLASGKNINRARGFIFCGETKYIIALAQEFSSKPTAAKLVIENISWSRINQHKVADWREFADNHLDIIIRDVEFKPGKQSGLSEKISLNQLNFTAVNKTVYNYWDVSFIILLYQGQNIININKYSANDFMSGQERQIQAVWPGEIVRVGGIEIIPEINIMDEDNYIRYEGGVGEEK
ncbi:MAG: hypothetical protein U9R14_01315, partial [Patescibacteria group bacterium]|nr:hypothetical protein [Patescibacteria group bacterium]